MKRSTINTRLVLLVTLTLVATAAGAAFAQSVKQPVVRVYRSRLPNGNTSIEGFFRVDPELLGTTSCDYTASIDVKDKSATLLYHDDWKASCPTRDGVIAPALERFLFAIPAQISEVTVDVGVTPKDGGKNDRKVATVDVKGLSSRALTSDLILGRMVGLVDSTNKSQFNMRHGDIGIRAATEIVLNPESSNVSYYLEMYPPKGRAFNGTAFMVIRRGSDNAEVTRRELQKLADVKAPQPIAGNVSLAGLGDGQYSYDIVLQLADTTITASHAFEVSTPAVATSDDAAATGYFYTLPDKEIETTFGAAVMFGMNKEQMDLFTSLSTNAKRAYLTRFFGSAPPDPNHKPETALDAFLSRSRTVQARYSERAGHGKQEGWRTDRGRIYIRRGEPTNRISRPSPRGGSPYEIFYYANNRGLFYLFIDDTRMGNYKLMYTNDPAENQTVAGWDRKVGTEAIEDLKSLGIRVIIDANN